MTVAILYAMQGLIHLQPGAEVPTRVRDILTFLPPPRQEDPPERDELIVDRELLTKTPVPPGGPAPNGTGPGIRFNGPTSGPGPLDMTIGKLGQPDGPLISIVRVQPTYPAAAEAQGIEGWVDVRFDVMTDGQVVNIDVISSSHRMFENSAIKAARRFRFRAPVVDGIPQVATGIEYRFRFTMNNS